MKFGRTIIWVNCWLFVAFGAGFAFMPELLAKFITGVIPSTPSAIIDLLVTYGGMALGLAYIFSLCAKKEQIV